MKDADIADADPDPVGEAVPVAMNIRSMKFHYYSDQGGNDATELAPVYGDGQYDATIPGNNIAQRNTRAAIESVRVELIGMNAAPDVNYASPLEPAGGPFAHYREYQLSSLIVPRNVGKRAVKEESLKPPNPAKLKTICWGACGVPYITWQSPTDGNVDFYSIIYDTDPNGSFSQGYPVGNVTEAFFPRPLDPGTTYYFKIEASNGYGDAISGETGAIKPVNGTTPKPPTKAAGQGATTNQTNKITLTFTAPSYYTDSSPQFACVGPLPGSSSAGTNAVSTLGIAPPENIAYRIYRSTTSSSFDPSKGEGTLIASEANGTQPYVDFAGVATFTDVVPACLNVYYRVQAVKASCVGNKDNNSPADVATSQSDFLPAIGTAAFTGTATTTVKPSAPANLKITRSPITCPTVANTIGPNVTCGLSLTWDKVVSDVNGAAIKVGTYTVTRKQLQPSAGATTATFTVDGAWDQPGNGITWTDNPPNFATDGSGISYQYEYDVVANGCSGLDSAAAVATEPSCYFALTNPVVATTTNGGAGSFASPYQLYGGSSTLNFTGAGLTSVTENISAAGVQVYTHTLASSPGVFTWPPGLTAGQLYQIDFQALKNGCYYTQTIWATEQGGVCNYSTAPSGVPNPAQVTNGTTQATAWQLKPNDTVTFTH